MIETKGFYARGTSRAMRSRIRRQDDSARASELGIWEGRAVAVPVRPAVDAARLPQR
jgi:hypothetical protein